MRLPINPSEQPQVLWRVSAFGRQHVPAGQTYWWENASRQPPGRFIVQATLQGSIHFHDSQRKHIVRPGDLMLFAYGEQSAYGQPAGPLPQPYDCAWVCLDGAGLLEHINALRNRVGSVCTLGTDHTVFTELEDLIATAESTTPSPPTIAAAAAYSFIMCLHEAVEQQRIRQLTPAQRAVDFILHQPHRALSTETVAQRFGCSREHLSRLFRDQTGQSPNTFINTAKTQRALRLLRSTDLPLAQVASQAGFPTAKTMTRHIHRATGHPPGRLRNTP